MLSPCLLLKRCLYGNENCGSCSNVVCFLVHSFSVTRSEWNRNSGVRFEEPSIEAMSVAFIYKKKLVLDSFRVWQKTCDALGACWLFLAKIGQRLFNVAVRSTESRMEARLSNVEAWGCSRSTSWSVMRGHPLVACQDHIWLCLSWIQRGETRRQSWKWKLGWEFKSGLEVIIFEGSCTECSIESDMLRSKGIWVALKSILRGNIIKSTVYW